MGQDVAEAKSLGQVVMGQEVCHRKLVSIFLIFLFL